MAYHWSAAGQVVLHVVPRALDDFDVSRLFTGDQGGHVVVVFLLGSLKGRMLAVHLDEGLSRRLKSL